MDTFNQELLARLETQRQAQPADHSPDRPEVGKQPRGALRQEDGEESDDTSRRQNTGEHGPGDSQTKI